MSCAGGRGIGRLTIMSEVGGRCVETSGNLLPRKHTEMHGRKDESKILMATESTEEHEKIKIN